MSAAIGREPVAIGLVLLGMLAGLLGGGAALAADHSLATALLAYAGAGSLGVMAGAGARAFRPMRSAD